MNASLGSHDGSAFPKPEQSDDARLAPRKRSNHAATHR